MSLFQHKMAAALLVCAGLAGAAKPVHAGASVTLGNNLNLSKLAGIEANTTIAINPANPQIVAAFSAHGDLLGNQPLVKAISTDGGQNWVTTLMGDGTDGIFQAYNHPSAVFDSFGNLYVAYLTNNLEAAVVASFDNGTSFTNVSILDTAGSMPTLVAGSGSTPGTTVVWCLFQDAALNQAARFLTPSALGTIGTFSPIQEVPNSPGGNLGDIAIGPNGQVIVCFQDEASGAGPDAIMVSVDPDGSGPLGFTIPTVATATNVGAADGIKPQPNRGVNAAANIMYDTTGGQFRGRCYLVYTDQQPDGSDNTNIFLRSSDDDGATWSAAARVNDDTASFSQFLCKAALDPTSGVVGIVWYDCRADNGAGATDHDVDFNTDAQLFGTVTADGGATFIPNFQISFGSSNAILAGTNVDFGDYIGLAFYNNVMFPFWGDNSNSTGNNPEGAQGFFDVYTSKVTLSGSIITPPTPVKSELYVSDVVLFTQPVAGQPFTLQATITNLGPGDAGTFFVSAFNDPVYAAFNDGTQSNFFPPYSAEFKAGKRVDIQSISGLAVGASASVTLNMIYFEAGDAIVSILADSQRNASEVNELNNKRDFRVKVLSDSTDIVMTSMIASNTNPGIDAVFTATIENRGVQATGPFTVGFFASRVSAPTTGDTPDQAQAVANLAGGATITLNFNLPTQNLPRGGRAWVFADSTNAVVESFENNNTLSTVWGVPNDSPAILSSITPSTLSASVGENVTFTVGAADPNGDPLFFTWNFGDGTSITTTVPSVTHAFSAQGNYTVSVNVSDGAFSTAQSSTPIEILDNNIIDLGFVIAKSGYIKLAVPLPPGLTKRDRVKGKIVQGLAGLSTAFRSGRLTGKPGTPGEYYFTIEYLSPKTKFLKRVRYHVTVLN